MLATFDARPIIHFLAHLIVIGLLPFKYAFFGLDVFVAFNNVIMALIEKQTDRRRGAISDFAHIVVIRMNLLFSHFVDEDCDV